MKLLAEENAHLRSEVSSLRAQLADREQELTAERSPSEDLNIYDVERLRAQLRDLLTPDEPTTVKENGGEWSPVPYYLDEELSGSLRSATTVCELFRGIPNRSGNWTIGEQLVW